nr:efflux pump roqt [Quercus suber]
MATTEVLDPSEMNMTEKRIAGIEREVLPNEDARSGEDVPPGEAVSPPDDEVDYPKAGKLALITIALCLAVFCMALDNTIISTAIPRITDQFSSIDDVGWYGSSYLLTTCAFQLTFGKLYTFFSLKTVFLIAIFIFEVGSAVCGSAPNSNALIIGRAVAGLGSAGIFSGAILIISNTVPLSQRPAYTGAIGAIKVSWRWCFYINLPIGAVTAAFILFFYKPTRRAQDMPIGWKAKFAQFDIIGTLVFLPMIICLLLALQWGGSKYPWNHGSIIALFVVFGVLFLVFVGIQFWKKDHATVPPRIVAQRSIAGSAFYLLCGGGAFFTLVYYLPIWFQAVQSTTATESGIRNLPMILSVVVASLLCGFAITKIGYYAPFMIASSVISAIGAGLLSSLKVHSGSGMWIGYQSESKHESSSPPHLLSLLTIPSPIKKSPLRSRVRRRRPARSHRRADGAAGRGRAHRHHDHHLRADARRRALRLRGPERLRQQPLPRPRGRRPRPEPPGHLQRRRHQPPLHRPRPGPARRLRRVQLRHPAHLLRRRRPRRPVHAGLRLRRMEIRQRPATRDDSRVISSSFLSPAVSRPHANCPPGVFLSFRGAKKKSFSRC